MTIVAIDDGFARTMREVYGEPGGEWIARLPGIVAECEARFSLRVDPPFAPLSYNYVAPATLADGTPAVLKVGYPAPELFSNIAALKVFDGRASVRLLASDRDLGAVVLERVYPGDTLATLSDDAEATSAAAAVMRRLWRPAPAVHSFPTVAGWGRGFDRVDREFATKPSPFPTRLVAEASETFRSLAASMAEPVLLHGDLHHDNILAATREPWLSIDPKGLIGEPAYEVGALLRNPRSLLSQHDPGAILANRISRLSDDLGFDRQRVRGWGFAQAVLSAWWSYEDHGHGWEFAIACAELLSR